MKSIDRRNLLYRVGLYRALWSAALVSAVSCTSSARADLIISLRFPDGGTTRTLTAADVGTDVPIDVWATVIGPGPEEEGLQFATYSIVSRVAGALPATGFLKVGEFIAPFDAIGGSIGTPAHLNSDGIRDIGSNATQVTVQHIKFRSAQMMTPSVPGDTGIALPNGREWHVQRVLFHVDDLASSLPANDQLFFDVTFPSSNSPTNRALWREDGLPRLANPANPSGAPYLVGSSVSFTAVPEPATVVSSLIACLVLCSARFLRRARAV